MIAASRSWEEGMKRTAKERAGSRLLVAMLACSGAVAAISVAGALSACDPNISCPAAFEDEYVTEVGGTLSVPAPGLLANDQGIDGTHVDVDSSDGDSWNGAQLEIHSDGSFKFRTGADGTAGIDYFDYYIEDPEGGWDVNTVTVEVRAVIRDDGFQTKPGTRLTIPAPGIFGNDLGYDPVTMLADSLTDQAGDVAVAEDGSFAYTPPPGFEGFDAFTYSVYDTNGDFNYSAKVTIAVNPNVTPGTTAPGSGSGNGKGNPPNVAVPDPREQPPANGTTTPPTGADGEPLPGGSTTTTKAGSTTTTDDGSSEDGDDSGSASGDGDGSSAGASDDDDGSSSAALPIALGIIAVGLAGTGGYLWWRRRSSIASPTQQDPSLP
jgi:hypothetical protein